MKSNLNTPRLLLELVAAIAVAEFGVMFLMPLVAPGVAGTAEAVLDATLLSLIAGPIILWRLLRAVRRATVPVELEQRSAGGSVTITAAALLAAGLGLTGAATWNSNRAVANGARERFDHLAERIHRSVVERLGRPLAGLMGVHGLYRASKSVERSEFRAFFAARDLPTEFPGSRAFGFIQRVLRTDLEKFIASERADDAPEFSVKVNPVDPTGVGEPADLYVVKFVEPLEPHGNFVGYDIGSDSTRRAAAERAMRTGEPTLSGRVQMAFSSGTTQGFVLLLPVYKNGTNPTTPEEREVACLGLVSSGVVLEDAMRGVAEAAGGEIDFELFDGTEATSQTKVYGGEQHPEVATGTINVALFERRMFVKSDPLLVGGRTWTVRMSTTPAFEAGVDRATPALIGVGGALLSVLLAGIVWSLGASRTRALDLARGMTADLAASERRIRTIIEAEPECVKVVGPGGDLLEMNSAGLAMLEAGSVEQVRELSLLHFVLPEYRAAFSGLLEAVMGGATGTLTFEIESLGSIRRWLDTHAVPLRDEAGRVTALLGVTRDITAQRQAEQRVAESERRFRTLVEGADVVVWEFDWCSECFTYVSPQAHKFGYSLANWLSKGFWAAHIHPEDRERAVAYCQSEVAEGRAHRFQYRMIAADGRVVWIDDVVTVEPRASGFPLLRGVMVDITERMQTQEALQVAQAMAEDASRAKSAFLANMSHEIRTPLTAILGFADMLRDEGNIAGAPEHRIQAIDTIRNAGAHLLTVINDILDLSKIEADRMTIERIDTPLVGVLREVESLIRPRAVGKGVSLSASLTTPVPERVMSDPTRLRQILMNIAGNAVKFTEAGTVTIAARTESCGGRERLVIDVEDTGPGITPEQAQRLFQAFGQADETVTRKFGGTGLGLTISNRLAGLMGGAVTLVRTAPGQGSCFRVDLPLESVPGTALVARLDAVQESHVAKVAAPAASLTGRILLAEDGVDNQRLIAFHLRKAGATVGIADNGRIALELIEKNAAAGTPYDLLLTDMQMPEMDGYTLARTLRQRGSTLAIVALTAHAMAEDRAKCTDAGCDDYASKPIDKAKLLATCAAWMGRTSEAGVRVATS